MAISLDLITHLLRELRQHDSIMVLGDNLSKVAQFIVIKSTSLTSEVFYIFVREILRLNFVPKKIISYRDVAFTSRFCLELSLWFHLQYRPINHLINNIDILLKN